MSAELTAKLSINTDEFLSALKKAAEEAKSAGQAIGSAVGNVDVPPIGDGLSVALQTAGATAQATGAEINTALTGAAAAAAGLSSAATAAGQSIATGMQTASSQAKTLGNDTKEAADKTRSAGDAIKNMGGQISGALNSAIGSLKSNVNSAVSPILSVFGGGALLKGASGLVGSFQGLLEKGKGALEVTQKLALGLAQAGKSGDDAKKGIDEIGKSAGKLANQFGLPVAEVRAFSITALQLGGATGKANEDLTKLAIGIEKASGGLVSGTQAIRLFSKGVTDPEGAIALQKLTKVYPALGAAIGNIKNPAEATKKALDFFGPTFKELGNQAAGPLGSMQRLENAFGSIKGTLGKVIIEGAAPFVESFANKIIPAITGAVGYLGKIKPVIEPLKPVFIAAGAAIGLAATALLGLQAVQFVGKLADDSLKYGKTLVEKVIPALGLQTAAMAEAAAATAAEAATRATAMAAAEASALVEAAASAEAVVGAQARAAAAAEVVVAKEAELIVAQAAGAVEAEAAAVALAAAQAQAAAAIELVAAKQAEAAAAFETAAAFGVAATAAEAEAIATAEAALAADASTLSFASMWTAVTGPIGIAVAGIALLGVALYALYQNVKPFQEAVDAAFSFIVEVGKQVWGVFVEIGDAFAAVGELIFTLLILPFKLLWEVLKPIGAAIFDLVGKMFSFGDASKKTGGAMETITKILNGVKDAIQLFKANIEGAIAAVNSLVDTAGAVVDAITNWDFSGAWDALVDGAGKAGDAAATAVEESLTQDKLDKIQDKFTKGIEKATSGIQTDVDIKAKIQDIENIDKLQQTLAETQAKLPDLELKVRTGKATADEKKEFDRLVKTASETSEKIAKVAPQAANGFKRITNSAGELVQVTDINTSKVKEYAEEQKKAFDKESQDNIKKYSDNLSNAAAQLSEQKKKLVEIQKAKDAAAARGDTTNADKLQEDADKLQAQIVENQKIVKKGFEDGARSGLLTADAAEKVGVSLGFAAGEATKAAEEIKSVAEQTAAAAFDATKLAEAYKTASDNAGKALDASKQQGAGIQFAVEELRKGNITLEKFNKDTQQNFADIPAAIAFANEQRKKLLTDQAKSEADQRRLTRIGQANDLAFGRGETIKSIETIRDREIREVEERKRRAEAEARATTTNALELELKLLDIAQSSEDAKAEITLAAAQKILAKKLDLTKAEVQAEKEKNAKIASDAAAKDAEAEQKRNEAIGKFNLKAFEEAQKAEADKLKLRKDFAEKTAALTAEGLAATPAEVQGEKIKEILADRIAALRAANAVEISETIAKNQSVVIAEDAVKKAIEGNNAELIAKTKQTLAEARTDALRADPAVLAANRKAAEDIANLQKETAKALREYEISQIADAAERERQTRLLALEQTYAEEQKAAAGNAEKLFEINRKYYTDKRRIEQESENASIATMDAIAAAAQGLQNGIADGFKKNDTEEVRSRIKAENDKLSALKTSLIEGKINEDLYRKESEEAYAALEAAKREQAQQTFNLMKALNDALINGLKALTNAYVAAADKAIATFSTAADARGVFGDREAEAALKNADAISSGNQEEIDKTTEAYNKAKDDRIKNDEEVSAAATEAYSNTAVAAGLALGQMIANGENAAKAFLVTALDTMAKLIPILSVEIFGKSIAEFGPAGIAIAAGLTATLAGLAQAARGLEHGGTTDEADGIEIPGVRGRFIKMQEAGKEFVMNHSTTMKNLREFYEINRRDITIEQFAREKYGAIFSQTAVTASGSLTTTKIPAPTATMMMVPDTNAGLRAEVARLTAEVTGLRTDVKNADKRVHINASASVKLQETQMVAKGGDLVAIVRQHQRKKLF